MTFWRQFWILLRKDHFLVALAAETTRKQLPASAFRFQNQTAKSMASELWLWLFGLFGGRCYFRSGIHWKYILFNRDFTLYTNCNIYVHWLEQNLYSLLSRGNQDLPRVTTMAPILQRCFMDCCFDVQQSIKRQWRQLFCLPVNLGAFFSCCYWKSLRCFW